MASDNRYSVSKALKRLDWRMRGLIVLGLVGAIVVITVSLGRGDHARGRHILSVPSSIAADCSRPVDKEITQFLKSAPDHSTIEFARNGCYGQNDSLWISNRHDIFLDGNGATFKIVTTALNTTYLRSNWRVRNGANITLRNMTIVGACAPNQCRNGSPPPPLDGYGQHGINLESTDNPIIEGVHIQDVLSDGIEAQGTLDPKVGWSGRPTSNLLVQHSTIERAGRQLVGITDLDGGLIADNVIINGPEVGIDIEVDIAGFVARHIKIIRNTFDSIHAEAIANGGIGSDPLVGDITIQDNTMASPSAACAGSIYISAPGPSNPPLYRSGYTIRGNRFHLVGWFVQAERIKDLTVEGNITDNHEIGCGEKAALELTDSHAVSISGNNLSGFPTLLSADPATTGITQGRVG